MKRLLILVAFVVCFSQHLTTQIRLNDLAEDSTTVAFWHFDENAGSILHDASPFHNDGTIHDAVWVPGRYGTALHFNGVSSYVGLPNTASLKLTGAFTLEAWISLDTLQFYPVPPPPDDSYASILGNLGIYPWGGGYAFGLENNLGLQFGYRGENTTSHVSGFVPVYSTHVFHHVAAVYERIPVGGSEVTALKIYLNGVLGDSITFPEPIHYFETPDFYIGSILLARATGGTAVREFPGIIDEIRISRGALKPEGFNAGGQLTVSPATLNFGTLPLGSSAKRMFEITNMSLVASVFVDSITGTSSKYAFEASGFTLPPLASRTLEVTYAPTVAVTDSAGLSIHAGGPEHLSYNIQLVGRGFAPSQEPVIRAVADLPMDQGYQVRVTWYPSMYDTPSESSQISEYSLWRRVDDETPGQSRAVPDQDVLTCLSNGGGRTGVDGALWDFITTIPAVNFDVYAHVSPTLRNNVPGEVRWSVFRVAAHMRTGSFFFSAADSGCSTDNIAPPPPTSFTAYGSNGVVVLRWDSVAAADLREYSLYRSMTPNVTATPDRLVARVWGTRYTDLGLQNGSTYYYGITASDLAGNEGDMKMATAMLPVGTDEGTATLPVEFVLRQNFPNPFNPATVITFELPKLSRVRLTILNVLGQEVATLAQGVRSAGYYQEIWYPATGSGIYFCRLDATSVEDPSFGFRSVRKMVFLK